MSIVSGMGEGVTFGKRTGLISERIELKGGASH